MMVFKALLKLEIIYPYLDKRIGDEYSIRGLPMLLLFDLIKQVS